MYWWENKIQSHGETAIIAKSLLRNFTKIKTLVKKGATAILVSHELWMIEKYCDRVVWIDKGKIIMKGNSKEVLNKYLKK